MGYRYMRLVLQTTIGTTVPTDTYIDFIKESATHSQHIQDPQTVGYKSPVAQSTGLYGPIPNAIDIPMNPTDIGYLLYMLFGTKTTHLVHPGSYLHEFKPSQTVRFYTVAIGKETFEKVYDSFTCKKWTWTWGDGSPLGCSFDTLSRMDEIGAVTAPTFATNRKFLSSNNMTVMIGGAIRGTKGGTLSIEGVLKEDKFNAGDRYIIGWAREVYKLDLSLDLWFDDEVQQRRFYDGLITGGLGKSPANSITQFPITIDAQDPANLINAWNPYRVYVNIPQCVFDEIGEPVSERTGILQTIKVKAVIDPTLGEICQVDLYNERGGY
ncbi:hypothetical protein KKH23_11180 [Patescibacteria group bacterium]|nr:hypothetical protein [Patescibacteria group bacterium]